jgi:RNA polymerase sigma-70 factor (ECF subfamily)
MKMRQASIRSLHPLAVNLSHNRSCARNRGADKNGPERSIRPKIGRRAPPHATEIDLNLVQKAMANDADTQDQLFKMCAPRLYRTAFAVLRNREDAEDAVQDSWFRAYKNLKSFQGRSSFSTWLTRIVINSALMILRKNRHKQEASTHELEEVEKGSFSLQLSDPSPNPEHAYAQQERRNVLNGAIGNLQPRLRTIVQMGPLRELSLKETARDLGLSVTAVKAQVFRARVALRKSPVLKAIIRANNGLAA